MEVAKIKRYSIDQIPTNGRNYSSLRPIYPLFSWEKCCKCEKEFRRENGWFAYAGINNAWPHHLCSECAPTIDDAYDIFENLKYGIYEAIELLAKKAEEEQ
jgi:hypothetical protein